MYSRARSSEQGSLILPLAITAFLFIAALGFGIWAFAGMNDYKNNVDSKVATAVAAAKEQEDALKDAAHAEADKSPLRTYHGPTAYGSVTIKYPKSWSGYVSDISSGSPYVNGYFYPGVVPSTQSSSSAFALRVQVVQTSYSNELNALSGYVKQGLTKVKPYKAPKVSSLIGARADGKLPGNKDGSMVLIPLRNMTLLLWTEAPQFKADFDKYILANFTFAP